MSRPALSGEAHNLILIVPEALPTIGVDQSNASALARLRHEGVNFINSHSGFPRLASADPFALTTSDLGLESLVAAAVPDYATAFVNDTRAPGAERTENLQSLLDVTLPQFKESKRPFFLIYRLAEPESVAPSGGATRPAYRPNPRAVDSALAAIEATLKSLNLFDTTNIIVAAEHSFSRVLKVSNTSHARALLPREDTLGTLPPGFLAIDLTAALQTDDTVINLFDTDQGSSYVDWSSGGHPKQGNAIIAPDWDPSTPYVTVEAHGTYDSIYLAGTLSKQQRRETAAIIMEALLEQDYLGGVFVNEKRVGAFRGALSMSHIMSGGSTANPPDMVVAFASVSEGCAQPLACTSVIADTPLAEGEGVPNSFSRVGTWTFMAARGPDFQRESTDRSPASNADIARTVAELLHLDVERGDQPRGRVLTESLAGAGNRATPAARKDVFTSTPSVDGLITEARLQSLGSATYLDAAVPSRQERVLQAEEPRRRWHWPSFKRFTISISDERD
ncbi:MAG: alkaline phosphatase family protein [Gammaproteobacteria bacterium]